MGIWDFCLATGMREFLLNRGDVGFPLGCGSVEFSLCQGDKGVPLSHRELLNEIFFLGAFPRGARVLQLSLWKEHQEQSTTAVPTPAATNPKQG